MMRVLRELAYGLVLLTTSLSVAGCEKKAPPDLHIARGYALLASDPQAAYDELGKAKNSSELKVVLGRGLALEALRRYDDAERTLLEARNAAEEPSVSLALARVRVMLGKADEARPLVDAVTAKASTDLLALLLETCLANDELRARNALAHLAAWPAKALGANGMAATIPGEYYLAQASLNAQLKDRDGADAAAEKATKSKLSGEREVFALVALAVKAGRPDFAIKLLRRINDEISSSEARRRVAELAHGLEDHRLVGQILGTLPGSDAALLRLRAEHEFATRHAHAEVSLRSAIDASEDKHIRARLQLMLGETLLQSGQSEQARAEVEKMLTEHPDERGVLFLARLDLAEGKAESALQRLTPVLSGAVVAREARALASLAHLRLRHPERARPLLDASLKEHPNDLTAARLRVALEIQGKNLAQAVHVAEGLVSSAPNDVRLRLLLAEVVRKLGGANAEAESLRKAIDAVGGDARLWLALALAHEQAKADGKALAVLAEAHERLPQADVITAALASRLARNGQAKQAALLYEELVKNTKGEPVALNNLAMLYVDELGDANRAVELAEQAYRQLPQPAIGDTLGWALFKRRSPGDIERAQDLLDSAGAKLTSPTSKYHRGALLIAARHPDEGKRLLRQALAQSGDFAEAEQARELLGTGP